MQVQYEEFFIIIPVVLHGTITTFRGFILQARSKEWGMLIGRFIPLNKHQQLLGCRDAMGVVAEVSSLIIIVELFPGSMKI